MDIGDVLGCGEVSDGGLALSGWLDLGLSDVKPYELHLFPYKSKLVWREDKAVLVAMRDQAAYPEECFLYGV